MFRYDVSLNSESARSNSALFALAASSSASTAAMASLSAFTASIASLIVAGAGVGSAGVVILLWNYL